MFKISLAGLALLVGMMTGYSQSGFERKMDTTAIEKNTSENGYIFRGLKLDEINIASGYYTQNGNHSAVTGGIGTERLSDISNTFELKLLKTNLNGNIHHFNFGMGFDSYTSASSDKIDTATSWVGFTEVVSVPNGQRSRSGASSLSSTTSVVTIAGKRIVTSASYTDQRYYPSLSWSMENPTTGITIGAGLSYSTEWDYQSMGATFNIGKASKSKNTDIGLSLGAFLDTWSVIYPAELRPANYPYGSERDIERTTKSPRNTFNAGLTFNQVINKRVQVGLMLEPSYQDGLLGTKYQRVYFQDGTAAPENMPSERLKIPIGIRASWFIGDHLVLRPYYRYYEDSWHLKAQTASLEASIKVSPFVSLIPFYRYYTQNGISYFAPYGAHTRGEEFFTSDYDLSKLSSQTFGMGVRIVPKKGVMAINAFKSMELRYAHYDRSTDLKSNILTAVLTFK